VIEGLEGLQSAYLCDLAGPGIRMQKVFLMSPPLLSHGGTHLATAPSTLGSGPLGLKMPGDVIEPSRVLLLDVTDPKAESEVCRPSPLESGLLNPLAFSPDDRLLAVNVHYWLVGEQWYKPAVQWLLDPQNAVHVYDVASRRCIARLPGVIGTQVIFAPGSQSVITCVPSFHSRATTPDGKPFIPTGDFPIRVYDDRLHPPVLAILSWSLVPTAAAMLLGGLWTLWRSSRRGKRPAEAADFGPTPDGTAA
jgi:hypothetical protein